MKLIGIDPSLRYTCLVSAVLTGDKIEVTDYILIETAKETNKKIRASSDLINRCREIYLEVKNWIDADVVFAETPSGSQSASGMKSYGVSCFLIATINPAAIEVTPLEVKLASVGNKSASKKEIIDWAYNLHPNLDWPMFKGKLQNKSEHIADAIAVIYAGIKTNDFQRLLKLTN